jgi:predicted porin
MQKKIIALAVAGLVSGAAFAQSNVVIYGVADAGYVYASKNYTDNVKSTSKIYSGGQSGSRLGFKGTEDLGNGLSATFRLEMGINIDNGDSAQGSRTFGRWSTVGLAGKNWGEVQIGRRDTFMDEMIGGFDATGRNTVAQASPIMRDQGRYSNMIAYLSPTWSGFQVKAGVSTAAWDAQEVQPGLTSANSTNIRVVTAGLSYINGPLKVGGTYEYNKAQTTEANSYDAGNQWVLAAAYDFGPVAISAEYGQINNSDDAALAGNNAALTSAIEKRKQWTVGAMFKIGAKDRVGVQYARGTNEFFAAGADDEKARMWGVNYFHDLSKRTNIYAGYGNLKQDSDNTVKYGLDGQDNYQRAIQVGLRHQF